MLKGRVENFRVTTDTKDCGCQIGLHDDSSIDEDVGKSLTCDKGRQNKVDSTCRAYLGFYKTSAAEIYSTCERIHQAGEGFAESAEHIPLFPRMNASP